MGKIKLDGDSGHTVGRELVVRQPEVGPKVDPARVKLLVELGEPPLEW